VFFAEQSSEAIAAGAFHNDVVAVANERVLFAHEQAFADRGSLLSFLEARVAGFEYVEVPASEVPLSDAIRSYLFNAQLVSGPDGEATLVVPTEVLETPSVHSWLERHVRGNGPIRNFDVVDVRQSMANGGGPACLRLRVVADPQDIDPRFMVDEMKLEAISNLIERYWPEEIANDELQRAGLIVDVEKARSALLESLSLAELI
jgi:succinylarginine dihydrolase